MEVAVTLIVCSAIVLIVGMICFAAYKSTCSEKARKMEVAETRVVCSERILYAKEEEAKRLQATIAKLLEKTPTISIKQD
jgi:translation elongation factor EF-G